MNVAIVLGTRPEVIKLYPIIKELQRSRIRTKLITTRQHTDLLDQALNFFSIQPTLQAPPLKQSRTLNQFLSHSLAYLDKIFTKHSFDVVLIQGDTASAFVGAQAAAIRKMKVAHIEAGLRSHNLLAPWPEEMFRRLVAQMADFHFAPTKMSRLNLLKEGIPREKIFVSGNTAVDTLQSLRPRIEEKSKQLAATYPQLNNYVLFTMHRRETTLKQAETICKSVLSIARKKQLKIVHFEHPNPRLRKLIQSVFGASESVTSLPPQDYVTSLAFLSRCRFVITDSGGLQEEAPSLGKLVLVVREYTERIEGVQSGIAHLSGFDKKRVKRLVLQLVKQTTKSKKRLSNPYGDGRAASRIVKYLKDHL